MTSQLERVAKGIRDVSAQSGPVREPIRNAAAEARRLSGQVPSGVPSSTKLISALERAARALTAAEGELGSFGSRGDSFAKRLAGGVSGSGSRRTSAAAGTGRGSAPSRSERAAAMADLGKKVAAATVAEGVAEQWVPTVAGEVSDMIAPGSGVAVEGAISSLFKFAEVDQGWTRLRLGQWYDQVMSRLRKKK